MNMNRQIAWQRVLYIRLTSDYNKSLAIEIGNTFDDSKKPRIVVVGHKFPSAYKDEFVIDIYNLSYRELINIIKYQCYNIEIYAGYQNTSADKIFDGGIVFITNERKERNTSIAHLICASKLVARGNKFRNNFSFKSGLNMYSAIQYVNEKAGIKNSHVDESFKEKFLQETTIANNNVTSFLDAISKSDNSIIVSGDSSDGEYYSIWDLKASKSLAKKIDPSKGMIIQSFPQSTSDGIKFKSLPVVNYKVGMLISIDNAYIDTSVSSLQEAISTPLSVYLDNNGLYYIFKLDYSLDNYGTSNFDITITAKSRDVLANVVGV